MPVIHRLRHRSISIVAALGVLVALPVLAQTGAAPLPTCAAPSGTDAVVPMSGNGDWSAHLFKAQKLCVDGAGCTDATARYFHYYVPAKNADSDANRSLVIVLHGGKLSYEDAVNPLNASSEWMDIADREGLVVMFPNGTAAQGLTTWTTADDTIDTRGTSQSWNDCRRDLLPAHLLADDVAFLDALVAWARNPPADLPANQRFSIDPARIYVTGASNGGMMSYRMATQSAVGIAGIAAFIANLPTDADAEPACNPDLADMQRPRVPLMMVNGTADTIMPWNGGAVAAAYGGTTQVQSAAATLDRWLRWNNYQPATADLSSRLTATTQFRNLRYSVWQASNADKAQICRGDYAVFGAAVTAGAPVSFHRVQGGGHTEPSRDHYYGSTARKTLGTQDNDVEGAAEAWTLFKSLQ